MQREVLLQPLIQGSLQDDAVVEWLRLWLKRSGYFQYIEENTFWKRFQANNFLGVPCVLYMPSAPGPRHTVTITEKSSGSLHFRGSSELRQRTLQTKTTAPLTLALHKKQKKNNENYIMWIIATFNAMKSDKIAFLFFQLQSTPILDLFPKNSYDIKKT